MKTLILFFVLLLVSCSKRCEVAQHGEIFSVETLVDNRTEAKMEFNNREDANTTCKEFLKEK